MIAQNSGVKFYRTKLKMADGYSGIWKVVKETVKTVLGKHRVGMMLFIDDLPLQLGAYHPVGTNNIVLNRRLVEIVEATVHSKLDVNAFVYNLLTHEYLHALGYLSEAEVRRLVQRITLESFGKDHVATGLAEKSPWALITELPLNTLAGPKGTMEIVKDFDRSSQDYIR